MLDRDVLGIATSTPFSPNLPTSVFPKSRNNLVPAQVIACGGDNRPGC
jgi:hypothetical protein